MKRSYVLYILIVLTTVFIDQAVKYNIHKYFTDGIGANYSRITGFFNIVLVWNFGMSFSLFNSATQSQNILIAIALAIVLYITVLGFSMKSKHGVKAAAMITGGALGNILDRLQYGAVLDFLDFHLFGYHYPAFNLADTFIVLGAFWLLMINIIHNKQPGKQLKTKNRKR